MSIDDGTQERRHSRTAWLPDHVNITDLLQTQRQPGHSPPQLWNFTDKPSTLPFGLPRRNPHLQNISCPALFQGNKSELSRAKDYMRKHKRIPVTEDDYLNMTENCDNFRRDRGYIMKPLSQEEYDFPIAYSILMYRDVEQMERLLRAIYMPQNFYCIHIDLNADDAIHMAMRAIVRCFPNVFVASRLESVFWGHISIIYAEMNCLRDLLKYKWKYFINLTGQMFPLHTNRELVKILTLYDGANDIEGTYKR